MLFVVVVGWIYSEEAPPLLLAGFTLSGRYIAQATQRKVIIIMIMIMIMIMMIIIMIIIIIIIIIIIE